MMSRASFLEVPAHVFGLRLKILRYFCSGWLRARFSRWSRRSHKPPYHAISPGAAFLGAGPSSPFPAAVDADNLPSWLGEAFFRLPRRRGIWFERFARMALLVG